jgi:hypothetical protein
VVIFTFTWRLHQGYSLFMYTCIYPVDLKLNDLDISCLTPLSTVLELYCQYHCWGNWSSWRKPLPYSMSLTNYITLICMEYTLPQVGIKLRKCIGDRHWLLRYMWNIQQESIIKLINNLHRLQKVCHQIDCQLSNFVATILWKGSQNLIQI